MYRRETVSQEGITFTFDCQGAEPVTLQIPYIADYQMMNASLAYFTMQCLREIHGISEEGLTQGIAKAHWPCRMETVLPGVIIDGAHNEDGIEQFIRTAAHFAREREITILFSAVCDKKYAKASARQGSLRRRSKEAARCRRKSWQRIFKRLAAGKYMHSRIRRRHLNRRMR